MRHQHVRGYSCVQWRYSRWCQDMAHRVLQWMRKLVNSENKKGLTNIPLKSINLGYSHCKLGKHISGYTGLGYFELFILKYFQTYGKIIRIVQLLIFCHIWHWNSWRVQTSYLKYPSIWIWSISSWLDSGYIFWQE